MAVDEEETGGALTALEDREITVDVEARMALLREERKALVRNCDHRFRGVLAWARINTPEEYDALIAKIQQDMQSGQFWLDRIGLIAEAEPELVLTLLMIREKWLEEYQAATIPQRMLVDQAMIALYHQLRLHELMGNTQARVEHALFSGEPLRAVGWDGEQVREYDVDEHLRALNGPLLAAVARCHRMMMSALRLLVKMNRPSVTIHNEGQVNMAQQQVNIGKAPRGRRKKMIVDAGG